MDTLARSFQPFSDDSSAELPHDAPAPVLDLAWQTTCCACLEIVTPKDHSHISSVRAVQLVDAVDHHRGASVMLGSAGAALKMFDSVSHRMWIWEDSAIVYCATHPPNYVILVHRGHGRLAGRIYVFAFDSNDKVLSSRFDFLLPFLTIKTAGCGRLEATERHSANERQNRHR